jgi:hypothetical protein
MREELGNLKGTYRNAINLAYAGMKMRRTDDYWRCWKCGGLHYYRMTRCPVYP